MVLLVVYNLSAYHCTHLKRKAQAQKKIHDKDQLKKEFKKLKSEIELIAKDKKEKMPWEEFDYMSWIESKIENESFSEIVRKKALQ